MNQYYWKIDDGRIWGSKGAAFVDESAVPEGFTVQTLTNDGETADVAYLTETIKFYGFEIGSLASPDDLRAQFDAAVTARLEAFATTPYDPDEQPFDSMDRARLAQLTTDYAQWGTIANQAYDATWKAAEELVPQVMDGTLTIEAALAQLPALSWTPQTLEAARALKKAEIDANTDFLVNRDGLSYGGERFAMNAGAKLNWTGMAAMASSLPFPFTILTIDDKPFQLADAAALGAFLAAVMAYDSSADSPLTTGRALRIQVENAATIDAVNAIVDDRE